MTEAPRFPDLFKYTPLSAPSKQIRLFRIHAGSFDDDIRCDIHTVELDPYPKYNAISYVWGDTSHISSILVNGSVFSVRQNCLYALRQVRSVAQEGDLIWMDAICINQDDFCEKSKQVSLMGNIYKQAKVVFACIGDDVGNADNCCLDLEFLARHSRELSFLFSMEGPRARQCEKCIKRRPRYVTKAFGHVAHIWLDNMPADTFRKLFNEVYSISYRHYWSRVWIMQEIHLAHDVRVLCGLTSIDYQFLLMVYKLPRDFNHHGTLCSDIAIRKGLAPKGVFVPNGEFSKIRSTPLGTACEFAEQYGHKRVSTLYSSRNMQCADPRDRVYGMLNLIDWSHSRGPPTPDYSKTRFEVAIDYYRHINLKSHTWFWNVDRMINTLEIITEGCLQDIGPYLYTTAPYDFALEISPGSHFKECERGFHVLPEAISFWDDPILLRANSVQDRQHIWTSSTVFKYAKGGLVVCLQHGSNPDKRHICLQLQPTSRADRDCAGAFPVKTCAYVKIFGQCMEGDVFLTNFEYQFDSEEPVKLDSSFVCRKMATGYYAVVGFSQQHLSASTCPAGRSCLYGSSSLAVSAQRDFDVAIELYIGIEDALAFVVHDKLANGLPLGCVVPDGSYYRFPHTTMSSFGVACTFQGRQKVDHKKIGNLPSLDGRTVPCARCGQLFGPAVENLEITSSNSVV